MDATADGNEVSVSGEGVRKAEELKNKANDYFKGANKYHYCGWGLVTIQD